MNCQGNSSPAVAKSTPIPQVRAANTQGQRKIFFCFYLKATFHLTISMRGQRVTGKIQRNNYDHGNCGPSLTGKTMSVFLIFTQGTYRNVKNRWVKSSLNRSRHLIRLVWCTVGGYLWVPRERVFSTLEDIMSTVGRGHLEYRGECSVPQVIQNRLRRHKKKVSFQIVLYQRFQKRNREKQRETKMEFGF